MKRSQEPSIRRRLMSILLNTSAAVVLVTTAVFCTYELFTFRQTTVNHLTALGRVIAENSTAALAFDDESDARAILAALRAEPDLDRAALYDAHGRLFASFPNYLTPENFPAEPAADGMRYSVASLVGYLPVQQGERRLGTLYLRSNLGAMHRRLTLYGSVVVLVIISSFLIAYGFSRVLQRQITQPILSLAETARAVSERRDYSVRSPQRVRDEFGLLTEAFNHMLTQIEDRDEALREGAERMRAVLDSALSAVVVIDADGRIIDWTRRAETVFGWSRSEAMGQDLTSLVIPREHRAIYRRIRERYLRTGQGPLFGRAIETTALRRDRTPFPVELSISPLRTGNVVTFCGFVTDITHRKHAEEEIQTLNQDLEQRVRDRTGQLETANRELEAFSYSVSHDLRAPLRHIDGFTRMLERHASDALDEQGRRYLTTISDSARNMGRLIDDLLAFSRTGRAALKVVPVDQDALVADVITEGNFNQQDRPVDWQVEPLPLVHADPLLLRLVWRNLIGNAVKYSSRTAQPRIEIGRHSGPAPGQLAMYVRDNGVGFDMRYATKLFGVFQRLHSQKEFEGTGIGLAHVRRIITRHGGRVWAEGRPGAGATFYFSLPTNPLTDTGTVSPFS